MKETKIKEKNTVAQNYNQSTATPVGVGLVSTHNKTNCIINKPTANDVGADDPVRPPFEDQTQNKKSSKTYSNLISNLQSLTSATKGITLVALIITIIVMLILVGVTVSIALNGGLIGKAQDAKSKTEAAMRNEQSIGAGRIKVDGTWYNSIDDYVNDIQSDDQNDEPSKWGQDENGNITYDGEPAKLQVGDYVDYEKFVTASNIGTNEINNLYTELKEYSGYTGSTYEESYPITKEDLKWRVLDIKDGKIRLISDGPTATEVYLFFYQGYNNAVYLIDKVCRTLYTTEKGTAQNLKIEDIQNVMNLDETNGGWDYHNYINSSVDTGKYGGTKEYIGDDSIYPAIFAKEKTGYVDEVQGTELDLSEQKEPIKQTKTLKAKSKIKITQTYWSRQMSENNWINPIYQNIFIENSKGSEYDAYWLSSRCMGTGRKAVFYVYDVGSGFVHGSDVFDPSYITKRVGLSVRPVVLLDSDVEIGEKVGDTFIIK